MTSAGLSVVEGAGSGALSGFQLSYVADAGDEVRVALAEAWALRLESVQPVHRFRSYRGQRHLSGRWWSATTGRHVGFESWLERDQLMALDFDPVVVGIAERLRAAFADPLMLIEGATAAGDRIAVLPVAPDMQEYRGAIWNSQRTTKRFGQLAFSANLDTGSARVLSCASEDEPP